MKFPLVPEDLKIEIYQSVDKHSYAGSQRYRQLKKILHQVDDKLIARGIIEVFADNTRGKRPSQEQEFAGKLLSDLNPETDLLLNYILVRILANYNFSVEELPFYLADKFGMAAVENALESLTKEKTDSDIQEGIWVFRYWLNIK